MAIDKEKFNAAVLRGRFEDDDGGKDLLERLRMRGMIQTVLELAKQPEQSWMRLTEEDLMILQEALAEAGMLAGRYSVVRWTQSPHHSKAYREHCIEVAAARKAARS